MSSLSEICGASIPEAALAALADLRCQPGVFVVVADHRAWVRWTGGDEELLTRLLAVPGADLYVRRESGWSRLGSLLPSGPLPFDEAAQPLARVLTPAGFAAVPARRREPCPVRLRLLRTDAVQTTTALACNVAALLAWCETVPQPRLERHQAAWSGERMLLFGSRLPDIDAQRYWGDALLLPLGWRAEPDLPPRAWREALNLAETELLLWTDAGVETLDRNAFEPLTRAGLRLALASNDGRGANFRMDSTDAG
jgi:hypothetical protein